MNVFQSRPVRIIDLSTQQIECLMKIFGDMTIRDLANVQNMHITLSNKPLKVA